MSDKPPPYDPSYGAQPQGGQYPTAPYGYPPSQPPQGYPPQQAYPPGEKGGYPPQQSPYPSQPMYPQAYPQQPGYSQYPQAGQAGQPMLPQGTSGGNTTQTIIIQAPARPPSYMWLACLVYWCCNWLLGGIAFGLSIGSNSAAEEQNYEQARSLGRASMWVSISGIILTVTLAIIVLVIFLTSDHSYDSGYK